MNIPESTTTNQVGRTVAESTPSWPDPHASQPSGPNILLVVFDDLGWSDLGCFGSEIATPTIDRLATGGLRYTNFHVTPLCSPTRASLLSGRNHHAVGMRFLSDTDTGFDNSRGSVRADVAMLPELLRERGYGTYLVGKWHLTPRHEITPAGPFRNWPLGRGFDRFYGFLDGCTDQYAPELYEDNHQVERPSGDNYHLSADLADYASRLVTDHVAFRPERPFFLEFAFGATHAPFQAPRAYIDKYVDVFAKGWDRTRDDRLHRQQELGLVPPGTRLTPRNPGVPAWDSLSSDQQRLYTHLQATYAGFLEHADAQLGRLLATLERIGVREDTLVLGLSDNGASREGGPQGAVDVNAGYGGIDQTMAQELARLNRVGGPDGPAHYPEGWAMAGNTPFRRYKQFVDLGGVRSPLIVCWPRGIDAAGDARDQFAYVTDLAPTVLDLIDGSADATRFDGRSLVRTFASADVPSPRQTQYFEMLGHRAIWHRGWMAVTEHLSGTSYDEDSWRLYNTTSDFSECDDLASREPERAAEMQQLWWQEAEDNSVMPLDDRPLRDLILQHWPQGMVARNSLLLRPGQAHVPFASGITGFERSMRVCAHLLRHSAADQGVILASGNSTGGYVLYVLNGHLHFEHHAVDERAACHAPVPLGRSQVGFTVHRRDDRSALVELTIGNQVAATVEIPVTSQHLSFFGLDVGRDPVSQVSDAYVGEFAFPAAALDHVTMEFLEDLSVEELAQTVASTE